MIELNDFCVCFFHYSMHLKRKLVTHVICTELSGTKRDSFKDHDRMKIVSPQWILDSIKFGEKLPEYEYLIK